MVTTNTIVIYRGNDKTVSLTVKKPDKTAYNIDLCTITMYIKRKITEKNSDAAITLVATPTEAPNGKCEFYFTPATTNNATNLLNKVIYPYDIEVVTPSGKQYTVLRGSFIILEP